MSALKIEMIFPNRRYVRYMKEVTKTTLFINNGKEIDPEGLYSQEIFGIVGTQERMSTYAYIDLYVDILHPRLYEYICKLSGLYKKILSGESYAIFDTNTQDFIISDIVNGETGYDFFMKHIHKLKFKTTKSKRRQNMIDVLNKQISSGEYQNNKLLVLPAGFRDFNVERSGQIKEDEINDLYRDILNTARLTKNFIGVDGAGPFKYKLQEKLNTLYKHILTLLDGKKKMIQGEWASRAVEFKTRTVAVGSEDIIEDLDSTGDLVDIAKAGLALYVKSIDPVAKHELTNKFLKLVFGDIGDRAILINKDTLEPTQVDLPAKVIDRWRTNDGMDSVMNTLLDNDVKNEPVTIGDYYLFMLVDTGSEIIKYDDQYAIPKEEYQFRRPITYGELFYLSIQDKILELPGFITRHPTTDQGSVPPVMVDVFTTSITRKVTYRVVGITNTSTKIDVYPVIGESWLNGLKAPYVRTAGLGLDFDGDQLLLMMVLSVDGIAEVKELLTTLSPYISADGRTMIDVDDKVCENVFRFLTRGK